MNRVASAPTLIASSPAVGARAADADTLGADAAARHPHVAHAVQHQPDGRSDQAVVHDGRRPAGGARRRIRQSRGCTHRARRVALVRSRRNRVRTKRPSIRLPDFDLGKGLTIRPAITSGGGIPAPDASLEGDFQPSLDINQRIGANVVAFGTVNTDFAETEVDTRRTNLTRFPLFFPEKRTFFIEGDDIFSFGLGLNQDVIPYFSRRIGLIDEFEVPILPAAK